MAPTINSMALYYGLCGSISGDLVAPQPRNIQGKIKALKELPKPSMIVYSSAPIFITAFYKGPNSISPLV